MRRVLVAALLMAMTVFALPSAALAWPHAPSLQAVPLDLAAMTLRTGDIPAWDFRQYGGRIVAAQDAATAHVYAGNVGRALTAAGFVRGYFSQLATTKEDDAIKVVLTFE